MSNWVKKSDVIEMLDKLPERVVHDYGEYIEKDYIEEFLVELSDYAGTHGQYRLIHSYDGFIWVNVETKEQFSNRQLLEKLFIPRGENE